MTSRAILLGLLGACFVCGFTYFNDVVMRQSAFVGNYMPIGIYGGLILFILTINPLLHRLAPGHVFGAGEMAVMLTLTLAAACIPGPGLMRAFTATQIMPHHYSRVEPGWESQGVIDMVPEQMLAEVTPDNESAVLGGFLRGLQRPEGAAHVRFADIPWQAWRQTLWYWLPIILSLWIAFIGLALVVHRQWSAHEQLPYPIATFVNSLLPERGGILNPVLRDPAFRMGTTAVLAIHLYNFAAANHPDLLVAIPTVLKLMPLRELLPTFKQGFTHVLILEPKIFFTIVAIAYFLASEVSLSLAVGPMLYAYACGVFVSYGVPLMVGRSYLEPRAMTYVFFGAFIGMFLAMAWMGRRYYAAVFGRAVWPGARGEPCPRSTVWAARVFLIGLGVFIVLVSRTGVDWQIAIPYALGLVIIYLVQSRLLAETGVFFMRAYWWPCVILAGFFGVHALDPTTVLILMLITTVLALDPREAIMPFMVNSLKLLDLRRVPLGRTATLSGGALIIGMAVAVPVTLYFQYDRGYDRSDTRATWSAPRVAYLESIRVKQRLAATDSLPGAYEARGWARFARMRPSGSCMLGLAVGVGAVGLFAFCRVRFSWWPLHPVLFLMWHNYPGGVMAVSFLIGWFIKAVITRYGGAAGYQRFKPLMFGLIAGDLLAGVVVFLIGTGLFLVTGSAPSEFEVTP